MATFLDGFVIVFFGNFEMLTAFYSNVFLSVCVDLSF